MARAERRPPDLRYRPFASFSQWPRVALDGRRWTEVATRLQRQRADAPPQAWARAHNVVLRAATLDAARQADESDLEVVGTEASWRQAFATKGMPGVQALYEAEVRAHNLVEEAAAAGAALTEELLLRTHEELVASHEQYPVQYGEEIVLEAVPRGEYKKFPNYGLLHDGRKRLYAAPERVPAEVDRLTQEAAGSALGAAHPVVQAAYLLYAVDAVHPFADGNGRAARAVASLPLYSAVGVPVVVTLRSRGAYLASLETYDREGPAELVNFVFHRGIKAMTQASDILTASALS
ncbi:MAG: Fic family protein [Acidimicrobiia bacterium]|nr:Fic family protein [Acidimicrobiia bacterium]